MCFEPLSSADKLVLISNYKAEMLCIIQEDGPDLGRTSLKRYIQLEARISKLEGCNDYTGD